MVPNRTGSNGTDVGAFERQPLRVRAVVVTPDAVALDRAAGLVGGVGRGSSGLHGEREEIGPFRRQQQTRAHDDDECASSHVITPGLKDRPGLHCH